MSLVLLKRLFFSPGSPTRTCTPSHTLYDDPEHGVKVTPNIPNSGDDSQQDEHLLCKEATLGDSPPQHRLNPRIISDATIGLSDGLTVPFALSAGLSALGDTRVVIFGGIAELIAGAISMGLGGYLAARSEADSYDATLRQTGNLVATSPDYAAALAQSVFEPYDLPPSVLGPVISHISQSPSHLADFTLKFHHQLPPLSASRPYTSALTVAAGYFLGGLLPLFPYFFVSSEEINKAFWWSLLVMVIALCSFGYVKTCVVRGWSGGSSVLAGLRGAAEMLIVGGVAAGSAMGLVKALH